ncbi:uncharacterized [Tachysurus ichikawai]
MFCKHGSNICNDEKSEDEMFLLLDTARALHPLVRPSVRYLNRERYTLSGWNTRSPQCRVDVQTVGKLKSCPAGGSQKTSGQSKDLGLFFFPVQ